MRTCSIQGELRINSSCHDFPVGTSVIFSESPRGNVYISDGEKYDCVIHAPFFSISRVNVCPISTNPKAEVISTGTSKSC